MAVPGTKVEDNGLWQAAPAAWVGDRSLRRMAVRLPERSNGVEADARGPDRRPTLIQTQPQEDMDDFDRYAFITARRETLQTSTSLLCQELWATSRIIPGYGLPPPAAAQGEPLEDVPMALNRTHPSELSAGQAPPPSKKKTRRAIARQLQLDNHPSPLAQDITTGDHHDKAEEPGFPTRVGSSSAANLEADGVMFLGPRNENPDQPIRDPLDIQGALPSLELKAYTIPPSNEISPGQESVHTSGNTLPGPPEVSMEAPTQSGSDSTSTLTDNHAVGSSCTSGYTTNGSDEDLSKKDSTSSNLRNLRNHKPLPPQEGRPMSVLASYAAPDHSTFHIGIEEWPQLPGPGAQQSHGPSPKLTARPRESPVLKSTRNPPAAM